MGRDTNYMEEFLYSYYQNIIFQNKSFKILLQLIKPYIMLQMVELNYFTPPNRIIYFIQIFFQNYF
ncbi:hypothetical protein pb186bvf_018641 [Paramecium bursaria]